MTDVPASPSADVLAGTPAGQTKGTESTPPPQGGATAATTGRPAFRDLRRQLGEEDLKSPGVQKLLLEELERAEAQCENLKGYVERFHDADKRAALLQENSRTIVALEVMFVVGVGVGCAILTLSPSLWSQQPLGWLSLVVGGVLVIGSSLARVVKR